MRTSFEKSKKFRKQNYCLWSGFICVFAYLGRIGGRCFWYSFRRLIKRHRRTSTKNSAYLELIIQEIGKDIFGNKPIHLKSANPCKELVKSFMKRASTIFLQALIVLIGISTLAFLIRLPLTEGRAANLDLLSIYSDPFILYGYSASIFFFVGLYQAFKLLGYIGLNKVFSSNSIETLKKIKYCAIALGILIVAAGLYIKNFHHKDDDPAGFLAICIVTTFACFVVATAATIFKQKLQNAIDMKSENDLTI